MEDEPQTAHTVCHYITVFCSRTNARSIDSFKRSYRVLSNLSYKNQNEKKTGLQTSHLNGHIYHLSFKVILTLP